MPRPDASERSSIGDYAVHELRLGLVAFFVLSGFLLSRPWFAAVLDGRRPPDLRRYARARIARIVPAYYVALLGSIALLWSLAGSPGIRLPPASEVPLFFVFGQNLSSQSVMKLDPPMWSLAVETSFYAVLPLIGWLALRVGSRRRSVALVPLALLGAGVLFNWAIAGRGLGMTYSKTLAAMLPYFAVGMLAALLLHGRTLAARWRRSLIAGGITLVAVDATLKGLLNAGAFDAGVYPLIFRDLLSGAGFALAIGALAATPSSRILGGRVFAGLGAISYGFYLWHVPIMLFMRGHGLLPLDPVLGTLAALGPALAVSALSWIAIERPVIAWARDRNARSRGERPTREPTPASAASGGGGVRRREVSTVRT